MFSYKWGWCSSPSPLLGCCPRWSNWPLNKSSALSTVTVAVWLPTHSRSTVRAGPSSSPRGAQLLYCSHSDVESWCYSKNKSMSTLLCNWIVFYEGYPEGMEMHVCHASSLSMCICACMNTAILDICPYLRPSSHHRTHWLWLIYVAFFPRKLSDSKSFGQAFKAHSLQSRVASLHLSNTMRKAVVDCRKLNLI